VIELRARTFGDAQQMRGMIASLRHAAQDIGPALPRVVIRFQAQMRQQFATEGARSPSGPWAPLKPPYATWKARHFPERKILHGPDRRGHDGGQLRAALEGPGPASVIEYGHNSVFIGAQLDYAEYLQEGTPFMVARPPIEPTDRDMSEWVTEIWRHFESETMKLGWSGRFAGAMS